MHNDLSVLLKDETPRKDASLISQIESTLSKFKLAQKSISKYSALITKLQDFSNKQILKLQNLV